MPELLLLGCWWFQRVSATATAIASFQTHQRGRGNDAVGSSATSRLANGRSSAGWTGASQKQCEGFEQSQNTSLIHRYASCLMLCMILGQVSDSITSNKADINACLTSNEGINEVMGRYHQCLWMFVVLCVDDHLSSGQNYLLNSMPCHAQIRVVSVLPEVSPIGYRYRVVPYRIGYESFVMFCATSEGPKRSKTTI